MLNKDDLESLARINDLLSSAVRGYVDTDRVAELYRWKSDLYLNAVERQFLSLT